jgi:hypothetical protein
VTLVKPSPTKVGRWISKYVNIAPTLGCFFVSRYPTHNFGIMTLTSRIYNRSRRMLCKERLDNHIYEGRAHNMKCFCTHWLGESPYPIHHSWFDFKVVILLSLSVQHCCFLVAQWRSGKESNLGNGAIWYEGDLHGRSTSKIILSLKNHKNIQRNI